MMTLGGWAISLKPNSRTPLECMIPSFCEGQADPKGSRLRANDFLSRAIIERKCTAHHLRCDLAALMSGVRLLSGSAHLKKGCCKEYEQISPHYRFPASQEYIPSGACSRLGVSEYLLPDIGARNRGIRGIMIPGSESSAFRW